MMAIITPQGHALGWNRPLPGLTYPTADLSGVTILSEVDPRPHMPPALNQLKLGSCTANATNRCFRYDSIKDGKDCGELSRLWTYFFERQIEGTLNQGDCGAMGHDAFTVAKHGIPDETLWQYDISKFEIKPPNKPRAYTLTKQVKAVPQSLTAIQQALSAGQTIPFGFTVYSSFESEQVANTGIMPMPKPNEEVLGGHEVLACGYLKKYPHYLLVLNSWDVSWGLNGYFLMPVSFILDSHYASDLRTIARPIA
jgi:C1A family cysteine protease